MPAAAADLSGSGPQQVWVAIDYLGYDQGSNTSTWRAQLQYWGKGWGSWSASPFYWSLSGFGVSREGQFYIPESARYDQSTVLADFTFTRAHDSRGYLAAGSLTGAIDASAHGAVGSGQVGVGTGAPPRIPKAPLAPAIAVSSPGVGVLRAAFTAPQDNGGSGITGYELQLSADGSNWAARSGVTVSPQDVFGLAPGVAYNARYRAVNAIGTGPWSAWGTVTLQGAVPAAPPRPDATAVPGTLMFSWDAPPDGGSPITSYNVSWTRDGSGVWDSASTTSRSYTVSGVTAGAWYVVRVQARNAVGVGPWSATDAVQIPAAPPSAPAAPALSSPSAGVLRAAWAAPASDGGKPITGYRLAYRLASASAFTEVSATSPREIAGLVPGGSYRAKVRALNADRDGAWSAEAPVQLKANAPGVPLALTVVSPQTRQLRAAWAAPASDGGKPITGYDLWISPTANSNDGWSGGDATAQEKLITGMAPGQQVWVWVRARNADATGAWTAPVMVTLLADAPTAPQNLAVSSSAPGELTTSWAAPANSGGKPITGYDLWISPTALFSDGWSGGSVGEAERQKLITGMAPGQQVWVWVRARNADATGAWTAPVAVTLLSGMYLSDGTTFLPTRGVAVSDGNALRTATVLYSDGWLYLTPR